MFAIAGYSSHEFGMLSMLFCRAAVSDSLDLKSATCSS